MPIQIYACFKCLQTGNMCLGACNLGAPSNNVDFLHANLER